MHYDMDSFILYNVETNPSNNLEVLAAEPKEIKKPEDIATEPKEIVKERSTIRIQEISDGKEKSDDREKPNDKENSDTLAKKDYITLDTNYDHEILWHLEFDGSVNKLGARAGVWIYNLENDHS